jgi:hypothetical protein
MEFHPSPQAFDHGNPGNRPIFSKFWPGCVKYGQSAGWLTGWNISGLKGSNYEKDMDMVFCREGR